MKDLELLTSWGDVLKGRSWEIENPVASVIIMEGMEEHCTRYDDFAKFLNKHQLNVFALDVYGQGRNIKEDMSNAGVWPEDAFNKQVDAVHELILKVKNNKPVYVFSHSMGSFMSQWLIQKYSKDIDKITICGSGFKNPILGLGHMIAKMVTTKKNRDEKAKFLYKLMFGSFNKDAKIDNPRTAFDWLSYNEKNIQKYIDDPLCGYVSTNGFCLEFIKGMRKEYNKENLNNIRKDLPIFLISGDGDPVTHLGKDTQKLHDMYTELGIKDVEMKIYEHMRHEILNEDKKLDVYQDVVNFFLK